MELDDLKNDWEAIPNPNTQNILNPKIINQMTQRKYNSAIKKITFPEMTGGIICLIGLVFTVMNYDKLDTVFFQTIGIITIVLLIILPIISFLSISQFNIMSDPSKPYVEIIKQFASQKLRFKKYQQINIFLCYLLLVTVIILLPKLFYGKDISQSKSFWIFAFSFGYIFLVFFAKKVNKFYDNSLNQAKELLKEIES